MNNFIAIDFDTSAHPGKHECNFSVSIVKDGQIVFSQNSLIHWFADDPVGMGYEKPEGTSNFLDEWSKVGKNAKKIFKGPIITIPIVMHNLAENLKCFKQICDVYGIEYADIKFLDTLTISQQCMPDLPNHQLQTVAAACGYDMAQRNTTHSNAELCAMITIKLF